MKVPFSIRFRAWQLKRDPEFLFNQLMEHRFAQIVKELRDEGIRF
jgi:hypothetical protein